MKIKVLILIAIEKSTVVLIDMMIDTQILKKRRIKVEIAKVLIMIKIEEEQIGNMKNPDTIADEMIIITIRDMINIRAVIRKISIKGKKLVEMIGILTIKVMKKLVKIIIIQ